MPANRPTRTAVATAAAGVGGSFRPDGRPRDMEQLGDLVARDRRVDRPALVVPDAGRTLTYREFCTTALKAGNFLRHLGVGADHRVVVASDPLPEPVLTFLGAAQLGATTRFLSADAITGPADLVDPRAVVVGHERKDVVDVTAGTRLAVYGGEPSSPTTAHWEGQVWSENPAFPSTDVDPDTIALDGDGPGTGDDVAYTHGELLAAADAVVDALALDAERDLDVGGSLADPAAVVGLLAGLKSGSTVRLLAATAERLATDAESIALSEVPL